MVSPEDNIVHTPVLLQECLHYLSPEGEAYGEVPLLIDLPLAACILGFSVDHTRKMLQQGKIQAHKMGRDWRISKDAFRAYVEGVNNQP